MSPSSPAPTSEQGEPLDLETAPRLSPPAAHVPEGLVPADQLPSAANVLAELFPPEESCIPNNGSSKSELTPSLYPSILSEETSFPYKLPLPPFDPYSLSPGTEGLLSESSPIPVSAPSYGAPENAPRSSSLAVDEAVGENTVVGTEAVDRTRAPESVTQSVRQTEEQRLQQQPEPDAAPAVGEINSRRKRRGKTSFRRLATGIRKFLGSNGGSKVTNPESHVSSQAGKVEAADTPESARPSAIIAPDGVAELTEESHTPESVPTETSIPSELLRVEAPPSDDTQSDSVVGTAEVRSADPPAEGSNDAEASPLFEAPLPDNRDLDTFHLASASQSSATPGATQPHANFFSEESSQQPSQPTEPEPEPLAEQCAEEEPDPIDDDHAIATAIERYANTTCAAAAEAERIANSGVSHADFVPPAHSALRADDHAHGKAGAEPLGAVDDHVDINAVLGIPRDPELTSSPSAGPFTPAIAGAEAFALSESSMPAALAHESIVPEVAPDIPVTNVPSNESPENTSAARLATTPYRDWSFEEKIASHHEWMESKGATGKKADLTGSDLEGSDLIGVDLRFVDLHDANLRAADLLMADLRDACLVRANFRDSCLVGANLEAANLEGASLETAMGLVPRQFAGANLHEATLPPTVQFEALAEFKRTARRVQGYFVALLSLCALSALLIWMTKDYQLLTNSAVLFFLHSSAAASALPTVQFYLIAPMVLFVVYLVLQFHLQHLWDLVLELPAVFPDGRALGENEPRIVLGLLRAHFRWMNADAPSTRFVEKGISMLLAYWIVPLTLLLYWTRFLTLQQLRGSVLQALLIAAAAGVALYSSTKVGKPKQRWMDQENFMERMAGKLRGLNPVTPPLVLLGVLMYLAIGTMMGVPHTRERAPQFGAGSVRRWAPSVLWTFGIDPYADITEAVISKKPANWNGSDEQVSTVNGARLNGANFRYAQAYRAFLANAHLLHANLQGAFLSQADLRGAEMGQSNLKYAVLDQAQMNHVNLDRATLTGANLSRADLRSANLSYAAMGGAILVDARLDGATLYGSSLNQATLIRTNFEKADLRESHLEGANLEHVDMQGAYLWSAKLIGAGLTNADLQKAIFVDADLHGADLRWAHLDGTVLTGADLAGAYLDGADLRGAVGFGANQICAAKSRHGLLLNDAMQMQVASQCGAGN
ncbi:MAG TPA: pentapeptide repeat-containing protein [Candidatus Acidoferrales bacterium]|nr:pentapeptide repeat-containing protein [Candidatus Acidoferrales bacterium]